MKAALQTQAKSLTKPSFTPANFGLLQRKCACGGTSQHEGCTGCKGQQLNLQRRSISHTETADLPQAVQNLVRSPGQPLSHSARDFMEPRFGHDFSQVRVHTGPRADESTRAVNALAYTVGPDIAFGDGQYAPETANGQKLLAHELAHVVQQQQGALKNFFKTRLDHNAENGRSPSDDHYENEADAIADAVLRDRNGPVEANGDAAPLAVPTFGETPVPVDAPAASPCAEANKSEKMTACIQPIVIADDDGKNPTSAPSFTKTQDIWKKCCIEYSIKGVQTINKAAFKTLDQDPNAVTDEEKEMYKAAGVSSCIQVFVPKDFKIGATTGKNLLGGGVTLHGGTANPKVCVVEGAVGEVVAHEVGHASGHAAHDVNNTVMKPSSAHDAPNSSAVSADVCKAAKTGAVLTKGGTKDCCMDPK